MPRGSGASSTVTKNTLWFWNQFQPGWTTYEPSGYMPLIWACAKPIEFWHISNEMNKRLKYWDTEMSLTLKIRSCRHWEVSLGCVLNCFHSIYVIGSFSSESNEYSKKRKEKKINGKRTTTNNAQRRKTDWRSTAAEVVGKIKDRCEQRAADIFEFIRVTQYNYL